ncbi:MAG: cytochrome c biogenesis protein CcdA, partial [Nanoarchaeota archaeon]
EKYSKWIKYANYVFGVVLIVLGILVFVNQLSRVANLAFASNLLLSFGTVTIGAASLNIGIAFLAGFVSFLSPCVLPLIPAFLTYLASTATKK